MTVSSIQSALTPVLKGKKRRGFKPLEFEGFKSRRDNTLLTVGFNLRQRGTHHQVPQGRHVAHQVSSLRDLAGGHRCRRLKPTVNKVLSLRDRAHSFGKCSKGEALTHISVGQGTESRRPTYAMRNVFKAVSLAHERPCLSARLSALITCVRHFVGRRDCVPCPTLVCERLSAF